MMLKGTLAYLLLLSSFNVLAQQADPWKITATNY